MAFTSSDMELAWNAVLAPTSEVEWVDLIASSTGEYYRLAVTNKIFRHWNATTGAWESVAVPAGLAPVVIRSR